MGSGNNGSLSKSHKTDGWLKIKCVKSQLFPFEFVFFLLRYIGYYLYTYLLKSLLIKLNSKRRYTTVSKSRLTMYCWISLCSLVYTCWRFYWTKLDQNLNSFGFGPVSALFKVDSFGLSLNVLKAKQRNYMWSILLPTV